MKDWIKTYERYLQQLIVVGLFIVFGITRLWQLTTLPLGIHIDEAGMAYDAWCLANFGVDRYLKSWPVYLTNFSAGQSSLYAFICAALFRLFGDSMLMIRLPAVLFSLLNLVFGMKLARRIYPDSVYPALLTGGLIVIGPFFIMGSRFGLDCNLMMGASTVFLYFFLTAVENGRRWRYFLAGIIGGVLLYTYALSYIVLPVFLICCLIYLIWVKRFSFFDWVIMAVPLGILAFPLILVQVVNYFDLPEIQLGIFTITKLPVYRISEIGHLSWDNFVKALESVFIGDSLLFDSIPGIWNLYAVTAVLFVLGFVCAIVRLCMLGIKRQYCALIIPVCWFLIILIQACFMEVNTYRVNGIFYVTALLSVVGLWELRKHLGNFAKVVIVAACCIYILCFLRFGVFYYSDRYTEKTYLNINYFGMPIEEGIAFIESDQVLSQKMTYVWELGIYYAIGAKPLPQEFDIAGDRSGIWNQYWFGSLGAIEDGYNYMVPRERYPEYCEELEQAGFIERDFGHYSVFYKKE